jgi:hypothetical protein
MSTPVPATLDRGIVVSHEAFPSLKVRLVGRPKERAYILCEERHKIIMSLTEVVSCLYLNTQQMSGCSTRKV